MRVSNNLSLIHISTAKPAMENKEVKADSAAKPADPDDIYATLDWDCLLYTSRCV